ncbi:hypothetical protein B0O80DRAFT_467449 [Mortierella sp. GBAus27b]|nr:hypothetical protein B0O80DRAFT_467415 [Mortierella sp. GBAus27b]KAI8346685.1 hypothetical protein B0O80DRAFT_467449 [Mortierella sp. GBAus27b]
MDFLRKRFWQLRSQIPPQTADAASTQRHQSCFLNQSSSATHECRPWHSWSPRHIMADY